MNASGAGLGGMVLGAALGFLIGLLASPNIAIVIAWAVLASISIGLLASWARRVRELLEALVRAELAQDG